MGSPRAVLSKTPQRSKLSAPPNSRRRSQPESHATPNDHKWPKQGSAGRKLPGDLRTVALDDAGGTAVVKHRRPGSRVGLIRFAHLKATGGVLFHVDE